MQEQHNLLTSWKLTIAEKKLVEQRQMNIRWPSGLVERTGSPIFSKTSSMKAIDTRRIVESTGIYILAEIFKTPQQNQVMVDLIVSLREQLQKPVNVQNMNFAQQKVPDLLERYTNLMPRTEFFVLLHIALKHMWTQNLEHGPGLDCFGFERFVGWLLRYVRVRILILKKC